MRMVCQVYDWPVRDERELGELFSRLTRRVVEAERPLLKRHGLTMWEYTVLARLSAGAAPSQLALAQRIGYDKTRLIALLDGLADRGLLERRQDPIDRRARLVALTPAGEGLRVAVHAEIRTMEGELLRGLAAADRGRLRSLLAQLVDGA
jgi:DNA-binding MarR family transcriptional regulator